MKAPDKLYINKYMIRPGMLHPAEFPPDNPEWEYIRKDALLEWLEGCPLQLYQHIVWKYPSSPDVAKIKWYPRHEEIFMFTKGKPAYFNPEMSSMGDVWEISHIQQNNLHPAPFPLQLARRCVEASCPEGGLVYDPFMGSGTTAIAAIQAHRDFIGTEISPNYVEYASKRIQIAQAESFTLF